MDEMDEMIPLEEKTKCLVLFPDATSQRWSGDGVFQTYVEYGLRNMILHILR